MKMVLNLYFYIIFFILIVSGCLQGQVEETQIYFNNFEQDSRLNGEIEGLGFLDFNFQSNYQTFYFDESQVLGRFGWAAFKIRLDDLPEHDYITLEFDLYIHDHWEGNNNEGLEDVFILDFDKQNLYFSSILNTKCMDQSCDGRQSFPGNLNKASYPENANTANYTLPGICYFEGELGGSKKIHFNERRFHQSQEMVIKIGTDIKNVGEDLCNKSWSVDNIVISTLRIPDL